MSRGRAAAAVAAIAGASAALVVVNRTTPPPPVRLHDPSVVRLFSRDGARPTPVDQGPASSVLWTSAAGALRVDYDGVDDVTTDGATVRFRARAKGKPVVLFPITGRTVPAVDVRRVRLTAAFADAQPRPPLVGGWLRTAGADGAEAWSEARLAAGRAYGAWWSFDLEPTSVAGAGGTLTGVRIEMSSFAGGAFELGRIDVIGGGHSTPGFRPWSEAGHTRPAWTGKPGAVLAAAGRVPPRGHLEGAVARHPASAGGPILASVVVSGNGHTVRRAIPLGDSTPDAAWGEYDIPLESFAGQDVDVTLSVEGAGDGLAALWGEPLLVSAPRRPRGLVLVSVDTLRGDVVFPRRGEPAMPRLRERAHREGQVVDVHYAAANWTLPAHASLFTGEYPSAHGACNGEVFAPVEPLLAAALRRDGFFTAGVTDGGLVSAAYGFADGFDRYDESVAPFRDLEFQTRSYDALLPHLRGRDFFLFVHTYFVHDYADAPERALPRLPPDLAAYYEAHHGELVALRHDLRDHKLNDVDPRFLRLMRALYEERARIADAWLDGFLGRLAQDFATPPLVVVTSDHGESFGEGPAPGFWHHGGTLREPEVRVPLVVFHPDRRSRPAITDLTSQVDLLPTLLGLLGVPAPPGRRPGLDLLDAAALAERREVYAEDFTRGRNQWAAVGRSVRLLRAAPVVTTDPPRAYEHELRHAAPGRFDDVPAEPATSAEARAIERRRLDFLYATVDGLFLQLDNTGSVPQSVALALDFDEARRLDAWFHRYDTPLQGEFLEPDDAVDAEAGANRVRAALTLAPGDTDVLVVKRGTQASLAVDGTPGGVTVSVAGEPRTAPGPLVVGRFETPALPHPPRLPPGPAGVVLRVWVNAPDHPPHVPAASLLPPAARDALRAMGYVE